MDLCIFTGRATRDPEVRTSADGSMVARFSLAVDTGWGDNRKSNFFNMVAFGRSAESVDKLIRQGTKIICQCEARQNIWEDRDGHKRSDIQFAIQSWEFAESKKSGDVDPGRSSQTAGVGQPRPAAVANDGFINIASDVDEELPFG